MHHCIGIDAFSWFRLTKNFVIFFSAFRSFSLFASRACIIASSAFFGGYVIHFFAHDISSELLFSILLIVYKPL